MTQITRIDQQITSVRRELRRRERINVMDAASWQAAWDRHPDLRERETDLFRQRGIAQQERDEREERAARVQARRSRRLKKCPTCGSHSLAA